MRQLGGCGGEGSLALPVEAMVGTRGSQRCRPSLSLLSLPFTSLVWTMSDSATSGFMFRRK